MTGCIPSWPTMRSWSSLTPSQHNRVEAAGDLDQALSRFRMEGLERVPYGLGADDAAFLHERLRRREPTLAVFVVDQRKPAFIGGGRIFTVACKVGIDDLADAVRISAARHGAGSACIEIGHESDGLFA